jgi:YggT family protein
MVYLVNIINFAAQILSLLIIISAVLSFFMSPFHPIRLMIDRIVNPMLAPIRRVVPAIGAIDFSPLILLILIQVVSSIASNLLLSIR